MDYRIILLRGVNVSGKNLIRMDLLKSVLKEAGIEDPKTYIQSGNLILKSTLADRALEKTVHELIQEKFGNSIQCFAFDRRQWKDFIQNQPFDLSRYDQKRVYCCLFHEKPDPENMKLLNSRMAAGEEAIAHGQCIYLYYANGAGTTRLTNAAIEKKLNMPATTRNWNTMQKLLAMAYEK